MAIRNPNADEIIKDYDELQTAEINANAPSLFSRKSVPAPASTSLNYLNVLSWSELLNMHTYEVQIELRASDGTFIAMAFVYVTRFNNTLRLFKNVVGDAGKMDVDLSGTSNLQIVYSHAATSTAYVSYRQTQNYGAPA